MSLQGLRQQAVRDITGTAYDYNSDWLALFDLHGIPAGDFNGRFLAWINYNLRATYTDLSGAKAALARANGATSFAGLGSFAAGEFRGLGQSMRTAVQGLNGGANIVTTSRLRHYSKVAFRRFRVVIPVFQTTGTPLVDTLFTGSSAILNFQMGFEYPFTEAATGLPARIPVTFSGANWVRYNNTSWDAAYGHIVSDVIDVGQTIAADAFFGLWCTVELPAGTYNNALPYTINATNFNERWACQSFATSSRIAALGAASDFALTSTSITHLGTTQTGVTGVFTPSMLLIEAPAGTKTVGIMGDSLGFGNNEGQAGSSTFGDSMGSALGNAGYVDRGVFEVANFNGFNIAKGSDGTKYWKTAANWKYRSQLLWLGNPTHVVNQAGVNDVSASITISGWAANTVYAKYAVASANSNVYMCDVAGTSAASGGPSGTGTAIVDNTCRWYYIAALPGSANPRGFAQVFADIVNVHDQIKAILPGAKIAKTTVTPVSSSSDTFATILNQAAATGWGDATTRYGLLNAKIVGKEARMQIDTVIIPNEFVEDSYPTSTGKWVVNGVANYSTQDGTHHNSKGADLAEAAVTADKFT